MCDYMFVNRQRRVLTISISRRRSSSSRSFRASCIYAALRCRRSLEQLGKNIICVSSEGDCPAHHKRWIDVCAGHRILLYESIADEKSPENAIASRLWRCSVGTASWLAEQAHVFDGQLVLEVGAGTGLCTLTLAATSTARVISSDLEETAVALVRSAALSQSLQLEAVITFDLGHKESLPNASWMIACDVMYTPDLASLLARRCAEQLQRGGHVIVTDPDRKPRAVFQSTLNALTGIQTQFVRLQEMPPLPDSITTARREGRPVLILLLVDEHCRPPFQ